MSDHTGFTPEQLAYGMSGHPTVDELSEWIEDYADEGKIVSQWADLEGS